MKLKGLDKLMNIMNIKHKNPTLENMTVKQALSRKRVLLFFKDAGYSKIPKNHEVRKEIMLEILKLPTIYRNRFGDNPSQRVVKDEYSELLKNFLIANGYPKFIPPPPGLFSTPPVKVSPYIKVRKSSVDTQIIRR